VQYQYFFSITFEYITPCVFVSLLASAQPHLLRPTALFAAHALQFAKLFDDTVLAPTTTTTTAGAAGTAAGSGTGLGACTR
jgi:hypothetical protein